MVTVDQEVSEWWEGHQTHLPRFQIGLLQEGYGLLASFHHRTEKLSSKVWTATAREWSKQFTHIEHRAGAVSPHVKESKTILDSGFHVVDSGFRIPITGFQIFFSWTWIQDSNRLWDSGFLELFSGFQGPGFRIPRAKISQIPESGFPYMGRAVGLEGLRILCIFFHLSEF